MLFCISCSQNRYRWYDEEGETPLFPFGHGLSYTTFEYDNITASSSLVTAVITNNGTVTGAEVAQLYIGFPDSAGEPPKACPMYMMR